MVPHKLDEMNGIKNEFYNLFKKNEWFKGAGLYQTEKAKYCIMTLVKKENLKDIPEIYKGLEVKATIII